MACFVTTLVYKNKSVVRKTNNEHPIFLGPVMFHFDGKTDSYTAFFSPLSTVLGVYGIEVPTSIKALISFADMFMQNVIIRYVLMRPLLCLLIYFIERRNF